MENPVGGKIHRDEDGRPSGLLSEAAAVALVWPRIARCTPLEDRIEALREAGIVTLKRDVLEWLTLAQQLLRTLIARTASRAPRYGLPEC